MKRWTLEIPIEPKSRKEAEDSWDGVTSSIRIGGDHVCVSGIEAENGQAAREIALKAVNRLLDQLSFQHNASHQIASEGRSYKIVPEEGATKQGIAQLTADLILTDTVTAHARVITEKRDADGNVIAIHDSDKPGKLAGVCTEAMSYFRRGMLAEHIHEQLRNHCLAIENVVSQICGSDGVGGREPTMMQHALKRVYTNDQARKNLRVVWRGTDPVIADALGDFVYEQVRCQLAHAKDGKAKMLPYSEQDVQTMRDARDVIIRVARDMIEHQLSSLQPLDPSS